MFEAWGIKLTADDVEETKISIFRALKVARKYTMLSSIIKSKHTIAINRPCESAGTVSIPNMEALVNKNCEELRNLTIAQV